MEDDHAIRIKNWHQFQHYRNRRPPWIKLHREILDNYQFHCLPDASKALLPCLWLLASEFENGEIPLEIPMIAFRFHMTEEKVRNCLKELREKDFVSFASMKLASRKQCATPEGEVEREREAEAETRNPALNIEETKRQIALRREYSNERPRTNFERSAAVTDSAIDRVLGVSRKVDARIQPSLPPANGRRDGVGVPRNTVRSKRG